MQSLLVCNPKSSLRTCALLICLLQLCNSLSASPSPGTVFREYTWIVPEGGENESFLRVGGHFDYRKQPPLFRDGDRDGELLRLPFEIDLRNAIRAEIEVQKTLCHDHTTGLSIQINHQPSLTFPEAKGIPQPQEAYMHHFMPEIQVPLAYLKPGSQNWFSLSVDPEQPWNWPQNLVYGLTLRIYYDPAEMPECPARMQPIPAGKISVEQPLGIVEVTPGSIQKVDYLAYYKGVDFGGDGIYTKWHFHRLRDQLKGHAGTSETAPFDVKWNTEWLPDQTNPIKLSAIATDGSGLSYFLPPVEASQLDRPFSVELCKPTEVPEVWCTRNGQFQSSFELEGDLSKATEMQLCFRSWSPGYLNGIYLNDQLVMMREGPNYEYYEHTFTTDRTDFLYHGKNSISTGLTPRHQGEMVHGTEILWPGIMVLVKYDPEHQAPEWKRFPKEPTIEDFDAKFRGFINEGNLYLQVMVEDETFWEGDGVDIMVRTNTAQIRSDKQSDACDHLFKISCYPLNVEYYQTSLDGVSTTKNDLVEYFNETTSGWELVFKIPREVILTESVQQNGVQEQIGFEISVIDEDPEQETSDHLTWNSYDRIPGHWIEHNTWGVASLGVDFGKAEHSLLDWTQLPMTYPAKSVHFRVKPLNEETIRPVDFEGIPFTSITNWLPE